VTAAEIPAGVARDALAAVLEALDIPLAATVGDEEKRAGILGERVMHAVLALKELAGPVRDPGWTVAHLREQLAAHPAEGYRTWDEAVADRAAREGRGGLLGGAR
jgi:hypothetical protein